MEEKTCFKCGIKKPLTDYYRHPGMGDGYLGKCKECAKADVISNRKANIEYYAAYEQKRFKTEKRKMFLSQRQRKMRKNNPEKYKARQAVSNAIRDKRIFRQPCIICGNEKTQAHHEDYSRYLDVKWMCFKCHREVAHNQTVTSSH